MHDAHSALATFGTCTQCHKKHDNSISKIVFESVTLNNIKRSATNRSFWQQNKDVSLETTLLYY